MFETLFTIFFLPLILVVAVYWITKKLDKNYWFILATPIILSCIYISAKLGFFNWADSVGSRTHPDNETLMVVAFELQLGMIVSVILIIICIARIFWKRRKLNKTTVV